MFDYKPVFNMFSFKFELFIIIYMIFHVQKGVLTFCWDSQCSVRVYNVSLGLKCSAGICNVDLRFDSVCVP